MWDEILLSFRCRNVFPSAYSKSLPHVRYEFKGETLVRCIDESRIYWKGESGQTLRQEAKQPSEERESL